MHRNVWRKMNATDDISKRYVCPPDSPLPGNLAALWALDAKLAERIEALHPAEPYAITPSKSGAPTVAVPTVDKRTTFLHSRYEPVAEAKRLVDTLEISDQIIFYVFGCGLGYHIDALLERVCSEAIICVFTPGLPGPVTTNMLGNPETIRPR